MPQDTPEVWPPPIYSPPPVEQAAPSDPAKVARQQTVLGWTFLLLSLLAPPVFLPFAIYHGWKAWRGGEVVQGRLVLGIGVLLLVWLAAGTAWDLGVGH